MSNPRDYCWSLFDIINIPPIVPIFAQDDGICEVIARVLQILRVIMLVPDSSFVGEACIMPIYLVYNISIRVEHVLVYYVLGIVIYIIMMNP